MIMVMIAPAVMIFVRFFFSEIVINGNAKIKLYEYPAKYSVWIMSQSIKGKEWQYEFVKPQWSHPSFDSLIISEFT